MKITKAQEKKYKATLDKKLLAEWSKRVRAGGKCEVCGATAFLNGHHVLAKEAYPALRYCPQNGVSLCVTCHKFGPRSAHKNGVWFTEWLRTHKPKTLTFVCKHLNDIDLPKRTIKEMESIAEGWGVKTNPPKPRKPQKKKKK